MTAPVDVDQMTTQFLDDPAAQQAYLNDPTYYASVKLLKDTLKAVDRAMRAENIARDVRQRVIGSVLWGAAPSEREAYRRIADHEDRAELLAVAPLDHEALARSLGVPVEALSASPPGGNHFATWQTARPEENQP